MARSKMITTNDLLLDRYIGLAVSVWFRFLPHEMKTELVRRGYAEDLKQEIAYVAFVAYKRFGAEIDAHIKDILNFYSLALYRFLRAYGFRKLRKGWRTDFVGLRESDSGKLTHKDF